MNDKLTAAAKWIRRNAIFFTLTLSLITTCFVIVNYFATTNLRITQLANAQVKIEQDEKTNTAEHANFVTNINFKTSIDALKEVLDDTHRLAQTTNDEVTQILLRQK